MWSIREQENREESCRNILPKKKLVIKKKKIYHRSKGNRVLSSINCLIAYQYRSGINGDRLLTSTRVSTTRAWEQAGSILRINCINVSPTHFPINHRARSKWSSKIKNSLLEEMKISTNNTSNSREENDGSDETRGRAIRLLPSSFSVAK